MHMYKKQDATLLLNSLANRLTLVLFTFAVQHLIALLQASKKPQSLASLFTCQLYFLHSGQKLPVH